MNPGAAFHIGSAMGSITNARITVEVVAEVLGDSVPPHIAARFEEAVRDLTRAYADLTATISPLPSFTQPEVLT